jgi:hypothetical protein
MAGTEGSMRGAGPTCSCCGERPSRLFAGTRHPASW